MVKMCLSKTVTNSRFDLVVLYSFCLQVTGGRPEGWGPEPTPLDSPLPIAALGEKGHYLPTKALQRKRADYSFKEGQEEL